jgi:hypothetical protein
MTTVFWRSIRSIRVEMSEAVRGLLLRIIRSQFPHPNLVVPEQAFPCNLPVSTAQVRNWSEPCLELFARSQRLQRLVGLHVFPAFTAISPPRINNGTAKELAHPTILFGRPFLKDLGKD